MLQNSLLLLPKKTVIRSKQSYLVLLMVIGAIGLSFLYPGRQTCHAAQLPANETCCPGEQNPPVFGLTEPYMFSDEVKEYQVALKKLGYFRGKTSGIFDKATQSAVKEFQTKNNLKSDGIIGKATSRVLTNLFETGVTHTTGTISPKGTVLIEIDVDQKKLIIYENNRKFKDYDVAVGKERTPTPVGEWRISRKAKHWGTGFGTRWLGLNVPWGEFGIHGTNKPWSVGTEASGGCIRMFNHDVEEMYEWVKMGTVVRIVGQVYPPFYEDRWKVHKGHKGTAVLLVQEGLAAEGYLQVKPDGVFGQDTEEALKKLQKDRGFEVTGQVDVDIWPVLGL